MAFATKCPHCNTTRFELKEIEPVGSTYKVNVLQCTSCGAPSGIMDYWNIGTLLKQQEKHISDLSKQIQQLQHAVSQIIQAR
jgi:hypothetical protein